MKVTYDESDNSIQVKDGLKPTYLILKILMFLNLANALIRLIGQDRNEYGVIEYIWIGIGIASLLVLYYFLFKLSTAEKIPVDAIRSLKEKSLFGRKRYTFSLTNGRKRHLGKFKNEFELAEFRKLLQSAGIPH